MRIPNAPLYGAFARAWALSMQGIRVSFQTDIDGYFNVEASYSDPRIPTGGVVRAWGCDPDSVLNHIEDTLEARGVTFTRSRAYLEELIATNEKIRAYKDAYEGGRLA